MCISTQPWRTDDDHDATLRRLIDAVAEADDAAVLARLDAAPRDSGRGGSGGPEARAQQAEIVRLLQAGNSGY